MTIEKDHFVIRTSDLLNATRDFEALGFIVTQGSETKEGYNALIIFPDDSYLELIAYKRTVSLQAWSWFRRRGWVRRKAEGEYAYIARLWNHWVPRHREGWLDACVKVSGLAGYVDAARERGLNARHMIYTRHLASGMDVSWRMGGGLDLKLPFLLEDVTPRDRRLPTRLDRRHPNGVTGTSGVKFGAKDLSASIEQHTHLFGHAPDDVTETEARYNLPNFVYTICKVAPDDDVGEGLQEVTLISPEASAPQQLDINLTHGARIIIAPPAS